MRAKSNIGSDSGGFEYTLLQRELSNYPGIGASHVRWGERIDKTTRDVMAEAEGSNAGRELRDDAVEFLRNFLAAGPVNVGEVRAAAEREGIAPRTLERAKRSACVASKRQGFGKGSFCQWSLRDAASYKATGPHTPPPETVAVYEDGGGLCGDGARDIGPLDTNLGAA
jgi:putative DNA primase/helicase